VRAFSLLLVLILTAIGCATPAERFAEQASARGFTGEVVHGARFTHLVLRRPGPPGDFLHVYLDGDGSPLLAGAAAPDPTPRELLVLDLMAQDPMPSVYLGRPCYNGLRGSSCTGALWTTARYSEAVVTSLVAAVQRLVERDGVRAVVWIGYSGGGALARLAAPRLPQTVGLITVGANLALARWTAVHRAPPLDGSLDPAGVPALPDHVYERHYVGSRDDVVPPAVVLAGASPDTVVVVDGYGHVCCWRERWPAVLAELDARLVVRQPR